jgi:hypothetical protein
VFQQPDAGSTMDGWDIKGDPGNVTFIKFVHLLPDLFLIQIRVLSLMCLILYFDSRSVLQRIVLVKLIFVEQLIYLFTTGAAKFLPDVYNGVLTAIGSTMHTGVL